MALQRAQDARGERLDSEAQAATAAASCPASACAAACMLVYARSVTFRACQKVVCCVPSFLSSHLHPFQVCYPSTIRKRAFVPCSVTRLRRCEPLERPFHPRFRSRCQWRLSISNGQTPRQRAEGESIGEGGTLQPSSTVPARATMERNSHRHYNRCAESA